MRSGASARTLRGRALRAAGLAVLERNWRCRDGELDIVAVEGTALVFVEVKTRSTPAFGDPAEAVGRAKAARIRRLAAALAGRASDQRWPEVRFDVVAVLRRGADGPSVRHLRGAF